jgi:hypothetical protein
MNKPNPPLIKDLRALIIELKSQIGDEYRGSSYEGPGAEESSVPSMDVTVGADMTDKDNWSYQTGDNSYTGGAYGYSYWGVTEITRRSNSTEVARDLQDQLLDQWESSQS